MDETALILAVPEAEPLVSVHRERWDPSAAAGVPAHVTLLYPFLSPDSISPEHEAALALALGSATVFDVIFDAVHTFDDGVLHLTPEPAAPIVALMNAIWARWPSCEPYRGAIPKESVRPHLTVAVRPPSPVAARIEADLRAALPLSARVDEAWLIESRTGRWSLRRRFSLASR